VVSMERRCPFCKSKKFVRVMKEIVTIEDNGEALIDNICGTISISYMCFRCGKDVTEKELI